jgi:hypothetical protein
MVLVIAGYFVYHRVQQDNKAHLAQLQQQAQQQDEASAKQYIQSELNACIERTGISNYPALTPEQFDSIVSSSGYAGLNAYLDTENLALQQVQNCKTEYQMPN